jgi:protein gp37
MPVLEWFYWDWSWNPLGGCLPVDPSCYNCYAAQCAGTKTFPFEGYAGIHNGVTVVRDKRRVFNGKPRRAPDRHALWTKPLRWKGAKNPKLKRIPIIWKHSLHA